MVEKHFILDRSLGGVDSAFSMEPAEFRAMVDQIRLTEAALGTVTYEMTPKKLKARQFARSLYAVQDIAPGEPFTPENVRSIRPGLGLSPIFLPKILSETSASQFIPFGTPIELSDTK
jgi:pseudaminic acid synthase